MAVNFDIKKQEYAFIDGSSGEELTREQFAQRYNKGVLGGIRSVLSTQTVNEEDGENKE